MKNRAWNYYKEGGEGAGLNGREHLLSLGYNKNQKEVDPIRDWSSHRID